MSVAKERENVFVCVLWRQCARSHRAVIRFYNGLLSPNSATLKQALHADLKLVPRAKTSWVSDILRAFEGLRGYNYNYTQAFLRGK